MVDDVQEAIFPILSRSLQQISITCVYVGVRFNPDIILVFLKLSLIISYLPYLVHKFLVFSV